MNSRQNTQVIAPSRLSHSSVFLPSCGVDLLTTSRTAYVFLANWRQFPDPMKYMISNPWFILKTQIGSPSREGYPQQTQVMGRFSKDDGDSNENVKKAMRLLSRKHVFTCIAPFCTVFCRYCMTTTWKCLISLFMEVVNKRRRNFLTLSKLVCFPQEINSREIYLHLIFLANWNKRDKVWKMPNSF